MGVEYWAEEVRGVVGKNWKEGCIYGGTRMGKG